MYNVQVWRITIHLPHVSSKYNFFYLHLIYSFDDCHQIRTSTVNFENLNPTLDFFVVAIIEKFLAHSCSKVYEEMNH